MKFIKQFRITQRQRFDGTLPSEYTPTQTPSPESTNPGLKKLNDWFRANIGEVRQISDMGVLAEQSLKILAGLNSQQYLEQVLKLAKFENKVKSSRGDLPSEQVERIANEVREIVFSSYFDSLPSSLKSQVLSGVGKSGLSPQMAQKAIYHFDERSLSTIRGANSEERENWESAALEMGRLFYGKSIESSLAEFLENPVESDPKKERYPYFHVKRPSEKFGNLRAFVRPEKGIPRLVRAFKNYLERAKERSLDKTDLLLIYGDIHELRQRGIYAKDEIPDELLNLALEVVGVCGTQAKRETFKGFRVRVGVEPMNYPSPFMVLEKMFSTLWELPHLRQRAVKNENFKSLLMEIDTSSERDQTTQTETQEISWDKVYLHGTTFGYQNQGLARLLLKPTQTVEATP